MEIHVEQKGTTVKPIIMSTGCCFERCDIQALLEGFGIFSRLQRTVSVFTGPYSTVSGWTFSEPCSTVSARLNARGFTRPCSTVSLYMICVKIFLVVAVIQNVLFFSRVVLFLLSIRFQRDRPYSIVSNRLRPHGFVSVGFAEAQHVYMPCVVIGWHLSLDQHLRATLKQSSALLVQIHRSA